MSTDKSEKRLWNIFQKVFLPDFRQKFYPLHHSADVAASDCHFAQSHQGDCGRPAAAETSVPHDPNCNWSCFSKCWAKVTLVVLCGFSTSQDNDRGRWSWGRSGRLAAATHCQVGEENLNCDDWTVCQSLGSSPTVSRVPPDCRSFPSSLWATDSPLLSQVTSLSSTFAPSPRMHHLPTFSYASQPATYSSYLSAPPPPPPPPPPQAPPPPPSHCGSFQPCSFYYGQNQQLHSSGEERSVVTALTNYIEGACLSLRGEEPVWRPYWSGQDFSCSSTTYEFNKYTNILKSFFS